MNEPTHPAASSEQGGRVLVLAPDENLASAISSALHEAAPGARTEVARSLEDAQRVVLHQRPDLFVLDVDGIHDLGQEFLFDLRTSHPNARAIVLTAVHLASHRAQAAGLGAIHFLEKPFPHGDFIDLVQALLQPGGQQDGEKFQGTLSDLHIADIIQLKCMSGATSVLEFTGPRNEKARVFFEDGQVRHASALGKDGVPAFNEIVSWKGGMISEVQRAGPSPRTIDLEWQILLMDAVRKIDENRSATVDPPATPHLAVPAARKVLVIDDSAMLLSFVKEILGEAEYEVNTAATAEEGLRLASIDPPHLILLDYVLPDMQGDEVLRRLAENPATAASRVIYMSGFGTDLKSDPNQSPNVIGSLNKPFTSELLLKTVETYMPNETASSESTVTEPRAQGFDGSAPSEDTIAEHSVALAEAPAEFAEIGTIEAAAGGGDDAWWSAAPAPARAEAVAPFMPDTFGSTPGTATTEMSRSTGDDSQNEKAAREEEIPIPMGAAYFCGDTSFFSLNWALHTIGTQKLTGTLRCFWNRETVELLSRDGQILFTTTRDAELYCAEAPITLVNVEQERIAAARNVQHETGRPFFITLAQEGHIIREPALQLMQHYGQKLFAQLWTASKVRFMFEQTGLPDYAHDFPSDEDIDHWALSTLRFIQFQDLGIQANYDTASIPAYTRDGFDRVQKLRLTVAEAQFASQFNGSRSIAQIAKNLRLDLKFARLTLFRFLALEIVECWPPVIAAQQQKRGVFGRIFGG